MQLGPNLEILNWIDQLRRGQTQTMGKFWLSGNLWPRGSRSIAPETKGTLTKLFYTSGPNLVILNGWKVVARASLGLTHTYTRTHRHKDASNYNTRRPKLTWGKKNDFIIDAFSIEYTQEHLTESIKFFAVFAQLLECNDDNEMK